MPPGPCHLERSRSACDGAVERSMHFAFFLRLPDHPIGLDFRHCLANCYLPIASCSLSDHPIIRSPDHQILDSQFPNMPPGPCHLERSRSACDGAVERSMHLVFFLRIPDRPIGPDFRCCLANCYLPIASCCLSDHQIIRSPDHQILDSPFPNMLPGPCHLERRRSARDGAVERSMHLVFFLRLPDHPIAWTCRCCLTNCYLPIAICWLPITQSPAHQIPITGKTLDHLPRLWYPASVSRPYATAVRGT